MSLDEDVCHRCGSDSWHAAYLGNGCDQCVPERIRGAFDCARLLAQHQHITDGGPYFCPECVEYQPDHKPDCAIATALRAAGLA